jgi:hypothetical protein
MGEIMKRSIFVEWIGGDCCVDPLLSIPYEKVTYGVLKWINYRTGMDVSGLDWSGGRAIALPKCGSWVKLDFYEKGNNPLDCYARYNPSDGKVQIERASPPFARLEMAGSELYWFQLNGWNNEFGRKVEIWHRYLL